MLPLFYKHPFHHWILRPLRVVVFFCFLFFSCQTCSLYSPLIHTHSLSNSSHIWVLAHFCLSFLFEHCTVTGFVISRFLQFFIFSLSYIHLGVPSYSINKTTDEWKVEYLTDHWHTAQEIYCNWEESAEQYYKTIHFHTHAN